MPPFDAIAAAELDAPTAVLLGFRSGEKGTHTSRTMMLSELSTLLRVAAPTASRAEYRELIVEHNCLGKTTLATRRLTDQRLGELYALDPSVPLFRVMRELWQNEEQGQPLMALLLALARDPLLRLTAPVIAHLRPGEELARRAFAEAVGQGTHDRFNEAVLDKVVRNAASSWSQSGHLEGRSHKVRRTVSPTPTVVAFALLLGYALGVRGALLFETLWTKSLDSTGDELIALATDAKRIGLIDLRVSGGIVDVAPLRMLTEQERKHVHGTN
ncbi:MAG: hypothetical protein AB1714_18955 [Acidobacteriota bacterium]